MTSLPANDQPAPSSLGVNDILFTVFRHKWKIIFCALLGIGAAAGIWFTKKPLFESRARILVKYVSDTKSALDAGQANIQSPDVRGANVLNGEIAILTSMDSVMAAVRTVTPQRILAAHEGGTNLNKAAGLIMRNFEVAVPRNSSVLELALTHADPQVAQDLLDQLIRNYQRRHVEVHRAGAAYEELSQQVELIRTRLLQTEAELRRQKSTVGVIDLVQSKQEIARQITTLRQSIFEIEAELADRRVQAGVRNVPGFRASDIAAANLSAETNAAVATAAAPEEPSAKPLSPEDLARHEMLSQKLAALKARELELILQYREGSRTVQQHRQQIDEVEASLKALGIDPAAIAPRVPAASATRGPAFDTEAVVASIRGLEAKLQSLTNQLARVQADARRIDDAEDLIQQTERRRALEEAQYTYFSKSLEQARLDQTIDATKLNNITILQAPSAAIPAQDKKRMKLAGGALAGGFALGFGLAFLLDLILDPSVKRRKDLESSVQLPVFLTVPDFGRNGHSKLKPGGGSAVTLANGQEAWPNGEIPPWEESDPMLPYYEALRDRVVMSYGEDGHKPKIVGLTSCDENVGVTRLATGLAASLSRDVERNVMFIGLSKGKVAISAFAKGKPVDALPDAVDNQQSPLADPSSFSPHPSTLPATSAHSPLPTPTSDLAPRPSDLPTDLLAKNLHSLATTGRNLAGASVVQSFSDLMPKLKVSDYDFIIFDLPPITQTSGAVRLASQMERTLLVVEAEKTSKGKIKDAKAQLARTKTQVATILNKARPYGPKSLHDDL